MKKIIGVSFQCCVALLVLLVFASCTQKKQTQFPDNTLGDKQPLSKPLVFSQSQPLSGKEISADSIKPYKTISLDIDKLPAKYFTVNDFKPFKNPIQPKNFDLDNLPDSNVNFDTITAIPFKMQQSILPKPVITKAGMPKLMPNTTAGILQFSEEEGLPGTSVYASLVDEQGMVWLATNKGLCMYTGEFLYIYTLTRTTPQGGNTFITSLSKDGAGKIWITTDGDGIYAIDIAKGILYHDKSKRFVFDITHCKDGSIWLTGFQNNINVLYLLDAKKRTIKEIQNLDYCYPIKEDKYHNIWMGNSTGISILSPDRKKIKKLSKQQGLNINITLKLFKDSEGDMWIGSKAREIYIISLKNKTISTINAATGFFGMATEITEDRQGKIWVIMQDTLFVINKQRTAFKNITANFTMLQELKGTSLTDTHGNIWIGSVDNGAVIIDTEGPLPENLDNKAGLWDSNVWDILEASDGKIWMGTYNGITIYDPANNEIRLLSKELGLAKNRLTKVMEYNQDTIMVITPYGFDLIDRRQKKIFNYSSRFLSGIDILNCTKDEKNRLWLGGINGLLQLDLHTRTYKLFNEATGFLSDLVWSASTDKAGNIWAGTDKGLALINPLNNTVKYLRSTEGLCDNSVMKIVISKNDEVWVATQKGITVLDLKKNTITNFTSKEGLVPDAIYDLLEGGNGMYAGTGDGMIFINYTDSTSGKKGKWNFVKYGKKEGFPFNDYNQNTGVATKNGQLWWGIYPVVSIVTQQVVIDSTLPVVRISNISIMDETTSFFSYKEIGRQIPNGDSIWNESKSKYYFNNSMPKDSGYIINNKISWDSTTALFKLPIGLSLPYNKNSVSFSFANSDIKGRGKIKFSYILEGEDTNWSEITEKPGSKNYFNLSPGTYTFRVCTRGFNGLWSNPATITFTIRSPWWQTWWAYILYVVALGSFAWAFAQYRSIKLKNENRLLEEKVSKRTGQLKKSLEDLKATQSQLVQSEKMASLGELTAGIAHEIQNPLNFVNNFSEVNIELVDELKAELAIGNMQLAIDLANDIRDNDQKRNHHGKRADGIVKGMLQHSRSSSGTKEPTDINALADEYLRLAYHGLRAKDKSFNALMKTDFDASLAKVNIIPQDIGRVILNLITNAFYAASLPSEGGFKDPAYKHEPTVTIKTSQSPPSGGRGAEVLISVKDNGPGIPQKILDKIFQPFFTTKPTGQGTGLGLSLSYDIVKAHGGKLKVETKEGEGSTFIIKLPVV